MRPIFDDVLVLVDSMYNQYLSEEHNIVVALLDPLKHKKLKGTVYSPPLQLSRKMVDMENPGLPMPRAYMDHFDAMREERSEGKNSLQFHNPYYPGLHTHKHIGLNQVTSVEVKEGDTIYFHYNALSEDTFVNMVDGQRLFKVPYDELFCIVKDDGTLQMLNNRILMEEVYDDDVEDIALEGMPDTRGKILPSGIVLSVNEKPEMQVGDVKFGPHQGKRVKFRYKRLPKYEIENQIYYVMREKDVVLVDGKPVNGYVRVKPDPAPKKSSIIITEEDHPRQTGRVLTGEYAGKHVHFYPKKPIVEYDTLNNEEFFLIPEGNIMMEIEEGTSVVVKK